MGRELQKKKNRSSVSKSRPKVSKRTKTGRMKVDFGNNKILSENWDRKLTLQQNYKRLGLSSRLVAPSGGVEKQGKVKTFAQTDSLAIPNTRDTGKIQHEEVQVERDPETGRILRVVRAEDENEPVFNPLNDPLNELEAAPAPAKKRTTTSTGIIAELEKQAAEEAEKLEKKRPRQQSTREEEWIASLVAKHGDNIAAMVRDKKLNPMQQTQGDIGRRVKKWNAKQKATAV